jgi:hypothetical protein
MGLSIEELELQSSECLPAREVMTLLNGGGGNNNGGSSGSTCIVNHGDSQNALGLIPINVSVDNAGIANGNTVQVCDVLNNNSILNDNAILGGIAG